MSMSDLNHNRRPTMEEMQARGLAASMRADPTLAACIGMPGFDSQAALAMARMHYVHQLSQLGGLGDLALLQSFQGGPGLLGRHSGSLPPPEVPSRKLSRTEKKRNREQQRRHEVNEVFDALIDLLRRIEPKFRTGSRKSAFSAGTDMDEHTITNRVDLLDYTMNLLQRLHDENEGKKKKIKLLIEEQSEKDKAVGTAVETTNIEGAKEEKTTIDKEKSQEDSDDSSSTDIESKDREKASPARARKVGTRDDSAALIVRALPGEGIGLSAGGLFASPAMAMGFPIAPAGAADFETAMGLLGSRLLVGGPPSALDLASARSSHDIAVQRALMVSNPLIMQRDVATFLGGGAAAALAARCDQQQQIFAGLVADPSSLAYHHVMVGTAGTPSIACLKSSDDGNDAEKQELSGKRKKKG